MWLDDLRARVRIEGLKSTFVTAKDVERNWENLYRQLMREGVIQNPGFESAHCVILESRYYLGVIAKLLKE